jgi:RNA polymerase sigma-70 factor, ECF subfamily
LYRQHGAFTWRSLRYLGVASGDLDDAMQELWVAAHRRLADFEGRSDIKTWLFGIAVNVQRNLHRSERRFQGLLPLADDLASELADPALEHEGQEAWRLVQGFVSTLDHTRRAIFAACLLEGLSAAEVAQITGLDVVTIYNRVRALRRSFQRWAAARRERP